MIILNKSWLRFKSNVALKIKYELLKFDYLQLFIWYFESEIEIIFKETLYVKF